MGRDIPAFVEASIFVNRVSKASTPSVTRLIVLTTSAAGEGSERRRGRGWEGRRSEVARSEG